MNTITINVTPENANYFYKANERIRNRVEVYINALLSETFCEKSPDERLLDIMEKASAEAKSNGYKPEMLEEILRNENE